MSDFNLQGSPAVDYPYGLRAPHPTLEPPLSKSWLFEIVDRESGEIDESFTLVLPPTAYTIKEGQRVSITKTFGNAFVDDYGADNIEITLKGISGTAHVFPTFKTRGSSGDFSDVTLLSSDAAAQDSAVGGYTGRDAFYIFRDKIMRYKGKNRWAKRELRVYDLADEQAYKCILIDFTLDRNSDQPLRYPFTINLFVYQKLDELKPKLKVINIAEDPISALNQVDEVLGVAERLYQGLTEIIGNISLMNAQSLELRSRYNRFLTQTTQILTSPLDAAKTLVDIAFSTIGLAYDTYRAGKYTRERYMNLSELLKETVNKGLKIYGFQISQGWQTTKTINIDGDGGIAVPVDASESVSRNVDSWEYEYSGLSIYTIHGDDTLQRIAQNELGDVDLWPYIAAVNSGIVSNDDLVPGEDLYIPVQIEPEEGVNKEQFIMTEDTIRDPYGSDIKIDSDGNIIIQESNDVALISGIGNVRQAIDLRLNTAIGSMLKQTAYGITAQAGFAGTTMAIRYLKLAIRSTVIQDPRVASVNNMIVTLGSDTLNISMNIGIVGADMTLPVSLVI